MNAILIGGAVGFIFTVAMTPLAVRLFKRLEWGQFIREDGPKSHYAKRGTATMGGIVFILGAIVAYVVAQLVTGWHPSVSGLLILGMMTGLGFVGFLDDFLKVRKQQSLGLGGWQKIAGQVIVATVFTLIGLWAHTANGKPIISTHISVIRDTFIDFMSLGVVLGTVLLCLWIIIITTSTSNAVNVTDGLDGLATGVSVIVFTSYGLMSYWQFNQHCGSVNVADINRTACYTSHAPIDLALCCAAIVGSLVGFLWWNAWPAKIIMGDTGSLGLGGALAAIAVLTRTELLLVIIAGLFVMNTGSVIVQRAYFKITGGKRIFRMSPIHHHFELKGWPEQQVVTRFWIIALIFAAIGVGLFYIEWYLV